MNQQPTQYPFKPTSVDVPKPIIKVVGLGGGGCNAINRMVEFGLSGVEFIACNTDQQALSHSLADRNIQLGPKSTRGLGAGGIPGIGEKAAEESFQTLTDALIGSDMVFLTAGLGGGTGTGAIPIAARVAKSIGAITVAIVTTPFTFEMGRRQKNAVLGLRKLRQYTDTLITVSNDRLLEVAPENISLEMAFRMADDVLRQGVSGISELITETGLINVDFAHIRRVMSLGGGALMSIGSGEGEDKARKALQQARHHPMLDHIDLSSAAGIVINFSGGDDLTFSEVAETLSELHQEAGIQAEIIPGVINDPKLHNRAQVILIVTGLGALPIEQVIPGADKFLAELSEADHFSENKPSVQMTDKKYVPESSPVGSLSPSFADYRPMVNTMDLDVPAFLRKRMKN